MSCLVKIHLKAEDESKQRQNTSHYASVSVGEGGHYSQCLGGSLGGVMLCAQALGAPVAGWKHQASAKRMTPAIPVEFGLHSCI